MSVLPVGSSRAGLALRACWPRLALRTRRSGRAIGARLADTRGAVLAVLAVLSVLAGLARSAGPSRLALRTARSDNGAAGIAAASRWACDGLLSQSLYLSREGVAGRVGVA
ncbi:hypothetical protein AB0H77_14665 [Streptomyces sp. NPDC050844]|uniref:hypothetical protein n=1 Tax=Streptomyces sp. NPDC050844 TaxID=3155790 RepID=UPI003402C51B